ncbi:MAG: DUF5606 domain-containing protein [Arachidicoccus sp.]|nr:DUF5606 domain-containing protein [Arachidicoccus sp.]
MEYNKIISVTGLGGLYELIGSKADGAIVRSLEDNTTKFVSSRIHQFSHLESIEVFTVRDNVNLTEVFAAIKNSSENLPDYKDANAVKKYLEKIYPDMDFDRVYSSDMKKMIRWYSILKKNNVDFSAKEYEEAIAENEPAIEEAVSVAIEEKPKKKAAPKKKKTEE